MFALLFSFLIEIVFATLIGVVVYQIFLSDFIKNRKLNREEKEAKVTAISKIAYLKLISNDSKEIENFVNNNAANLSEELVKKLVDRIEILRTDKLLEESDAKRFRFDSSTSLDKESQVEVEEAIRKRNG